MSEDTDFDVEMQAYDDASTQVGSRTSVSQPSSPTQQKFTPEQVHMAINETITIPLQSYPEGYPRQAAYQASESSWSIYRAFHYLHARVILDLQEEIRDLEKQLEILDLCDSSDSDTELRVRSRRDDLREGRDDDGGVSKRATLLEKIRGKLLDYGQDNRDHRFSEAVWNADAPADEILVKARDINTFQRPSNRDYRSLRKWFWNVKPLWLEAEDEYIKRREDLVSLRHGREWSGFDGFIENCIRRLHGPLMQKIFSTKELRAKNGDDKHVFYYSQSRVEKLVGIIITLIIFILLILPVVAMYKLTSIGERNSTFDAVGVLVVFTLLFSAAMSLLTKAQRHELFAASAAYCAVLVVFISNFNNDAGGLGVGSDGRGG
ncbi:hypothetical protein SVAN01_07727 [Stagonosporopsis vannaccii]|nr:hypothetical protein SVAN01_07727 [Stagonosporopsis vannaccii]